MNRSLPAVALGLLLLGAAPSIAQDTQGGYADLVARILPSVVNIAVRAQRAPGRFETMLGSGFIIDPTGYIVTNRHVVINSYSIVVNLSDGTRLPAQVIGHPPATDIALLKVTPPHPLPAIAWGDSDKVRVGDKVLAIGNPLGFGGTVTSGIVSALNRNAFNTPYDNYIQTDAAINHGNSGGPLFNMQGQVIGVNTILITSNSEGSIGLGLSIPSDDARFAATELRAFGRVRPGWIGADLQAVTPDLADAFGLSDTNGALVAAVDPAGPAAAAGLRPGDMIDAFNDERPKDMRALMRMIAEHALDTPVALTVHRAGADIKTTVTIKEFPQAEMVADFPFRLAPPPKMAPGDLGLRLAPLSTGTRSRLGLAADAPGVEVTSVPPESAADRAGLHHGDVILQTRDCLARDPDDVQQSVTQAQEQNRRDLAMRVIGPSGPQWVALPLAASE